MMKKLLIVLTLLSLLLTPVLVLAQDDAEATAEAPTTSAAETAADADDGGTSGMVTGVGHLHSFVRWIVVLITIVAIIKLGLGLVQNSPFDQLAQRIMMAFTIGITLQWLIGILYFVVLGAFDVRYRWEHAFTMTVAVGLAHMSWRFSKHEDSKIAYRNNLILVVVVLIAVFIGVALLPQGWRIAPQ